MNTGHLIVDPLATSHSLTDGNPYFSVKFQNNIGRIGGKLEPQDADSTQLQELWIAHILAQITMIYI